MSDKLSVVVITKDEENNIRACLESARWADEIVIIDDQSSDATRDIAGEYTKNIFIRRLDGFGAQKQFGIDRASGDWVLILDADEEISDELKEDIRRIMTGGSSFDGFRVWRKTFYLGKWIEYCGWYNSSIRLFRHGKGAMDMRYVHENVIVNGPVGEMKSPILHNSYRTIDQHVSKMLFYTSFEAKLLFEQGTRIQGASGLFLCASKPLAAFARKYFLLKGYKDGIRGLLISVFTGIVVFLNYMKLWELQIKR